MSIVQAGMFKVGDRVYLKNQPRIPAGVVIGAQQAAETELYRVAFEGGGIRWHPARNLVAQTTRPFSTVDRQRFLRDLAVLKLSHHFSDVLYSLGASRTQFLVYQFQPVLKFIRALPHGMLIADEVGLGKTIEAGLILKELIARDSGRRVLIVCPANLREKWRSEMLQRFGLKFEDMSAETVRTLIRDQERERGNWPDFYGIASLEGLRRQDLLEALDDLEIVFDLVIIDEAHHLRNAVTRSFKLGEFLSAQSDHILLLSATPVQTGQSDLLSLLRLVEPQHFEGIRQEDLEDLLAPNGAINEALRLLAQPNSSPTAVQRALADVLETAMAAAFRQNPLFHSCRNRLSGERPLTPEQRADLRFDLQNLHTLAPYYTRTRKKEVSEAAPRRSTVITVNLSAAEREFYQAWIDYLTALAEESTSGIGSLWALSMRERQAASSLHAAKKTLATLLTGEALTDLESSDSELDTGALPHARLTSRLEASRQRVQRAQHLGGRDTKVDKLIDTLQKHIEASPERKVLLFTFFKGTLHHLQQRLNAAGIPCLAISGNDRPEDRAETVEAFQQDSELRVLLSTEVGSEGLDFQFCDTVINYDLPWNPMRVEQRIGRIDRFGQKSETVTVFSFFVQDTIDTRILERLYERIGVFEHSIGELEPILGPVVQQIQADMFSPRLTDAERTRRIDESLLRTQRQALETEQFEASRAELLGQGDLIREDIQAMKASGRHMHPDELRALLYCWIEGRSAQASECLKSTSREGAWDLRLSGQTIARVRDWMREQRINDQAALRLLKRIETDGHAWCTFDSEVAQRVDGVKPTGSGRTHSPRSAGQSTRLSLIDANHPLIRTALADAGRDGLGEASGRIATLSLPPRPDWPQAIALFLFALTIEGIERQVRLLPVAIDLETQRPLPGLAEEALGLLYDGVNDDKHPTGIEQADLERLQERAFIAAEARRAETERNEAAAQASRLAARRTALQRSYEVRIERQETLAQQADPRIRPMREGKARKFRNELEERLRQLDEAPEPLASFDLKAITILRQPEATEQAQKERSRTGTCNGATAPSEADVSNWQPLPAELSRADFRNARVLIGPHLWRHCIGKVSLGIADEGVRTLIKEILRKASSAMRDPDERLFTAGSGSHCVRFSADVSLTSRVLVVEQELPNQLRIGEQSDFDSRAAAGADIEWPAGRGLSSKPAPAGNTVNVYASPVTISGAASTPPVGKAGDDVRGFGSNSATAERQLPRVQLPQSAGDGLIRRHKPGCGFDLVLDNGARHLQQQAAGVLTQLLERAVSDYGSVSGSVLTVYLLNSPDTARSQLERLNFKQAALASTRPAIRLTAAGVVAIVYLPQCDDLAATLGLITGSHLLHLFGRGKAYPYWFARGFPRYEALRVGDAKQSALWKNQQCSDVRRGVAPALHHLLTRDQALIVANEVMIEARGAAVVAYIAQRCTGLPIRHLLHAGALGPDRFIASLRQITGRDLKGLDRAVDQWLAS